MMRTVVFLLSTALSFAADPPKGAYKTSSRVYNVPALDRSSQKLHVFWPSSGDVGETFPLVSYLHGMAGGDIDIIAYDQLFHDMASFGLVIVAPASCGHITTQPCVDLINAPYTDCAGLPPVLGPPVSPHGWASYYGEGLKALEWAKNNSAVEPAAKLVNWTAGVGICGHSMGGQAATLAAGAGCAAQWDIRAAAIHHAAEGRISATGNIGANVSVPLAAFTTSGDGCCEGSTLDIFTNATVKPKVYRDQVGFSHLEPLKLPLVEWYNPWLAPMTAAWFRIYLDGGGAAAADFHAMIYKASDPRSLCNYAGPNGMAKCETVER